jgi:hypothetical protein
LGHVPHLACKSKCNIAGVTFDRLPSSHTASARLVGRNVVASTLTTGTAGLREHVFWMLSQYTLRQPTVLSSSQTALHWLIVAPANGCNGVVGFETALTTVHVRLLW